DMKAIVGFANELSSIDTTDVPVTAHVVPIKNVMRDDGESGESFTRDELFANAKTKTEEYIYVPKTFE
ncbi:MAG: Asp-tRNA(Asn)/Glu-tRNA(Gln) amidotransferase subunit GatC, partial [Acutalibacteraceae bacterium]